MEEEGGLSSVTRLDTDLLKRTAQMTRESQTGNMTIALLEYCQVSLAPAAAPAPTKTVAVEPK